jgi:hypothetical protein
VTRRLDKDPAATALRRRFVPLLAGVLLAGAAARVDAVAA